MRLVAAALILALLASGAAGQTKKQTPAVQTPATFRGAEPNADQTSIGDLKWFEVFKDPALHDLVKTAMVRNAEPNASWPVTCTAGEACVR